MASRTPRKRKPVQKKLPKVNMKCISQGDIVKVDTNLVSMYLVDSKSRPSPMRVYKASTNNLVLVKTGSQPSLAGILHGLCEVPVVDIRPDPEDYEGEEAELQNLPKVKSLEDQFKALGTGVLAMQARKRYNGTLAESGTHDKFLVLAEAKVKDEPGAIIMNTEFVGAIKTNCLAKVSEVLDIRKDLKSIEAPNAPNTIGERLDAIGILATCMGKNSTMSLGDVLRFPESKNTDGGLGLARMSSSRRHQNSTRINPDILKVFPICSSCGTEVSSFPFGGGNWLQSAKTPRCPRCGNRMKDFGSLEIKTFFVGDGIIWEEIGSVFAVLTSLEKGYRKIVSALQQQE